MWLGGAVKGCSTRVPLGLQVCELLAVSEDLQNTLSSLAVEKDQLAFSLRQEASYNQQLKVGSTHMHLCSN